MEILQALQEQQVRKEYRVSKELQVQLVQPEQLVYKALLDLQDLLERRAMLDRQDLRGSVGLMGPTEQSARQALLDRPAQQEVMEQLVQPVLQVQKGTLVLLEHFSAHWLIQAFLDYQQYLQL